MLAVPLVYCPSDAGRRAGYRRTFERVLGARRARLHELFLTRAPVLFVVIEDAFLLYLVVAWVRALTGRRTAGLLHGPRPLLSSTRWQDRWRRGGLRALRRMRRVHTLALMPFTVAPEAVPLVKDWIYDVRLWDLTEEERAAVEALRRLRQPGNRLVMTALGKLDGRKGFAFFAEAYASRAGLRDRFHFIACGRVDPTLAEDAALFAGAGGVVVDRAMTEAEVLGTYAAGDAVWCLHPEARDRPSGTLGRAVQLGIPVVVRQDSLEHRFCVVEHVVHVATTADRLADRLCGDLPARDDGRGRAAAARFSVRSQAALRRALGC